MIWITAHQVIMLHECIIAKTGGISGLRDTGMLESAIAAPLQTFGGEELYKTEIEKITRLSYGLTVNHAFVDGNKRIGALILQLLLQWNGYTLALQEGELAEMYLNIASGKATEKQLLKWVKSKIV